MQRVESSDLLQLLQMPHAVHWLFLLLQLLLQWLLQLLLQLPLQLLHICCPRGVYAAGEEIAASGCSTPLCCFLLSVLFKAAAFV